MAKGWGGKHSPGRPEAEGPEVRQSESQEKESFVLRTHIVGGVGVKK